MTPSSKRSLNVLTVESPCEEPWDEMEVRSDAQRFCGMCMQDVYDLSKLTTAEAEQLVFRENPACVRFFRRLDGTVVTSDCSPVRNRAFTRMAGGVLRTGAKILGLLLACVAALGVAKAADVDILGWLNRTSFGRALLPDYFHPVEMGEMEPYYAPPPSAHGQGELDPGAIPETPETPVEQPVESCSVPSQGK